MNPDEKKIVIARLQTMPENMKLSIGSAGSFSKWDLIENVESETPIGEFIAEIYMTNIRDFKSKIKS